MEIDGIFARGRTTAEARRIGDGEEQHAGYDDERGGLADGPPLRECSRTMLALAKIGLEMASGADIRRPALMVPALFFAVAMVKGRWRIPCLLLFEAACRGRATPADAQITGRTRRPPVHLVRKDPA